MKAQDFLFNKLKVLSENFPEIHIKYGYDFLIETHIVELLPVSEYYTNKNLDDAWINIAQEFLDRYQNEEVAFISADSSLSLTEIIFEFRPTSLSKEDPLLRKFFSILITENVLTYSFPQSITATSIITNNTKNKLPQSLCKSQTEHNLNLTNTDDSTTIAFAA